jgi:dihydroflavonol-4-reductase
MKAGLAVVTGANGHLGNNLVRALVAGGRPVRALTFAVCPSLAGVPLETRHGDVRDLAFLQDAFRGAETVYHTAACISLLMDSWPEVEAVNVRGVANVIEACRRAGVRRLVHVSSIHAYVQQPLDAVLDESRPLVSGTSGVPPYDRSKAEGERLVRAAVERGLDAVILNPTGIIGPYDFGPSLFGRVLLELGVGRLPVMVGGGFDWVDVRDVVDAALRAGCEAPPGSRYLLSGHWVSNRRLASIVRSLTNASAVRLFVPLQVARLAAPLATAWARARGRTPLFTSVALRDLQGNRRISHARASAELHYTPRPLQDTLADTLGWFRGPVVRAGPAD